MREEVKIILGEIKNPITKRSFIDENRLVDVADKNGELFIKYDRTNIPTKEKKEVEQMMRESLKSYYLADMITITSISSANEFPQQDKHDQTEHKSAANLKVGHGKIGNKVRVAGVKKVVAVASGKGGVGKSTFAVNLSLALRSLGHKVGILDADIYGPSVPMLLNKRDAKPVAGADKKILPITSYGLKFMSFGLFIGENDPVIWRGPMLGGVLNQFLFDVDWGALDYLIIDLPPGTGDTQLSMIQNTEVDGVIVISTPQDVALLDAKKGLNMFKAVNVEVLGMVENMSYFICDKCEEKHYLFGQNGVEKVAKQLGVSFLGAIPFEKSVQQGSDLGLPHMANMDNEGSSVWSAYITIADKL